MGTPTPESYPLTRRPATDRASGLAPVRWGPDANPETAPGAPVPAPTRGGTDNVRQVPGCASHRPHSADPRGIDNRRQPHRPRRRYPFAARHRRARPRGPNETEVQDHSRPPADAPPNPIARRTEHCATGSAPGQAAGHRSGGRLRWTTGQRPKHSTDRLSTWHQGPAEPPHRDTAPHPIPPRPAGDHHPPDPRDYPRPHPSGPPTRRS